MISRQPLFRNGLGLVLTLTMLTASPAFPFAQEISIPDPDLNAAIRAELQRPGGTLTEQDMLSLTHLNACCRNVRSIEGLEAARNLAELRLEANQLTSFACPPSLTRLEHLNLSSNPLTNLFFPDGLTNLSSLIIESSGLTNLRLPVDMTGLVSLNLSVNQLTSLTLPAGMRNLSTLDLNQNQLTTLTLPPGLTNLSVLALQHNQLTTLTIPPELTRLTLLLISGNPPLTTFVVSELLATNLLADAVAALRNAGISVFTYPLAVQLVQPRALVGAFQFGITGPPGIYAVLGSTDLANWNEVGMATNTLGSIRFNDLTAHLSARRFYQTWQPGPSANMVFIPPGAFIMGSPTNELHRNSNEGPQTTVTLTRGFWIGKYEVTQGEYLDVTGTNPSFFPGNLSRPVSSVSWPDATNYCWLLTQRELAEGRIPPGSRYRLPTEAEWEYAARAGTTTRFSYGDDPDYASLTNHAWYYLNSDLTVHPVGRKLPNPWDLYDMEGNVWEWTQDWLGNLPGGAVTDPQGPPSNPIGWKIIRGGGYDFGESDCRSARRYFFGNHPALNDSNLGFRVVLVIGQ